jgi:hypothetical protein
VKIPTSVAKKALDKEINFESKATEEIKAAMEIIISKYVRKQDYDISYLRY